jgi:hypothetical protein
MKTIGGALRNGKKATEVSVQVSQDTMEATKALIQMLEENTQEQMFPDNL